MVKITNIHTVTVPQIITCDVANVSIFPIAGQQRVNVKEEEEQARRKVNLQNDE